MKRLSFCESWEFLQRTTSWIDADDPCPQKVGKVGRWGGGCGITCIKSEFIDVDPEFINCSIVRNETWRLENLTLPGLLVCRSEVYDVSFRNTSLTGSFFCWNDIIDVDFTDADLSNCDLRCSTYKNVSFVRADLRNVDLRFSGFENCDFTDANMAGAKLLRSRAKGLPLSEQQLKEIAWKRGNGSLPSD